MPLQNNCIIDLVIFPLFLSTAKLWRTRRRTTFGVWCFSRSFLEGKIFWRVICARSTALSPCLCSALGVVNYFFFSPRTSFLVYLFYEHTGKKGGSWVRSFSCFDQLGYWKQMKERNEEMRPMYKVFWVFVVKFELLYSALTISKTDIFWCRCISLLHSFPSASFWCKFSCHRGITRVNSLTDSMACHANQRSRSDCFAATGSCLCTRAVL